jgi:RimJ/RimL family protein N-acetyltransferase
MTWQITGDVEAFLAGAGEFLRGRPVENTVLLTVANGERRRSTAGAVFGWYDGSGAFLMTPPRPPLLSKMPLDAARGLVTKLLDAGFALPGVNGPEEAAEAFAEGWRRCTGGAARLRARHRLYRLQTLVTPERTPHGSSRVAVAADRALVLEWAAEFNRSIGEDDTQLESWVDTRLANGSLQLWEAAGAPVSMASMSQPDAGMTRIQAVFTPKPFRGCGYAAAVTDAITRAALRAGATDIVLFTDVENQTSNGLYQRLGYVALEDRVLMEFASSSAV